MGGGTDSTPDPETVTRVRRELAYLGSDTASAPEVPPAVTARITAALRDASGAHAVDRPVLSGSQRAGLVLGAAAVVAAVVLAVLTLGGDPEPQFPAGPTASQITVAPSFPLSEQDLWEVVAAAPDLGPLADPARLASCLAALGYPPTVEVVGGRQLQVSGRPAILLALTGDDPDRVHAVAVGTGCGAGDSDLLAETTVRR
ncbi:MULTISPECIES: hypothetical protein [Mycolicibacterium]|uniref:hypothetical protein n=1 Tax=Mycolicibacterium TaxID=1866885 RepID=UPI001C3C4414|nr:hypothetical protein [Mycolicibacterium sp. PAM1]MBV5246253.1 hypothetical protein [Mycolicibacterium sp. PAM1]